MKKLSLVDLTEEVRDISLDSMELPEELTELKKKLQAILGTEVYNEIDDDINEIVPNMTKLAYEIGFQAAVNIMQGNLRFTISIEQNEENDE